jgi:tetratricopeptide (TPR) repeat protein
LGNALHRRGLLAEARRTYERALVEQSSVGDVRGAARTKTMLAFLAYDEGRTAEARLGFVEALATFERLEDEIYRGRVIGYLGNIARAEERYDDALAAYEQALVILQRAGEGLYVAVFSMDRAITYLLVRRPTSALAELERVDTPGGGLLAGLVAGYRVAALALSGRRGEARALEQGARASIEGPSRDFLDVHARLLDMDDALARDRARAWLDATEATSTISEHQRLARRILRTALDDVSPPGNAVVVSDTRVHVPGRGWIDLSQRPTLLRIAAFFAERRRTHPGEPSSVEALFAAGWPGERAKREAAAIRVRVALAHLRRAGLTDVLLRGPGGWYFDPR